VVAAFCCDEQATSLPSYLFGRHLAVAISTHLSNFFEQQRISKSLKPGQLAHLIGCSNISKNGSRIRVFEQTGSISKVLFEKLTRYFEIDTEVIEQLVELDRRDFFGKWLAWAKQPIQPYLVVRLMAAVYSRRELPIDIETIEEAEDWPASVARETRLRCCIVWSRRLSVWLDETGTISCRTEAAPGEPNTPWMGRPGKNFVLNEDMSSRTSVDWPKTPQVGF
jgi:hypothetical protein